VCVGVCVCVCVCVCGCVCVKGAQYQAFLIYLFISKTVAILRRSRRRGFEVAYFSR